MADSLLSWECNLSKLLDSIEHSWGLCEEDLRLIWPQSAGIDLNPYAAGGGWFGQYKLMQKIWKMSETLVYKQTMKFLISKHL